MAQAFVSQQGRASCSADSGLGRPVVVEAGGFPPGSLFSPLGPGEVRTTVAHRYEGWAKWEARES